MKKVLLSAVFTAGFIFSAQAQLPSNADFEEWTPSGNPAPFDWEEPTGWTSNNSLTEWTKAGVKKESPAQHGDSAVRLESVMIDGGWYSMICNGEAIKVPDFSAPRLDIISGGEPISFKPNYLTGYYKFTARTTGDSGYAVILLKKWNSSKVEYDTIGTGSQKFGTAASYTFFEIPVSYQSTAQPDSVVIAFYSTDPANPTKPVDFTKLGELIIDNITLHDPAGIAKNSRPDFFSLYPNPAHDYVVIKSEKQERVLIMFLTQDGRTINRYRGFGAVKIQTAGVIKPGFYFLKIESGNNVTMQKLLVR